MIALRTGMNTPLPVGPLGLVVTWDAPVVPFDIDVSAVLLGANGKVRSDADFVFYNQPVAAAGAVRLHPAARGEQRLAVSPSALPAWVERVAVIASADGGTFGAVRGGMALVAADAAGIPVVRYDAVEVAGQELSVVVLAEVYQRGDSWKIRAVGQGYANGLAGLAADFGIVVEESAPGPAQPAAIPARRRPGRAPAPITVAPPPQPGPASAAPHQQPVASAGGNTSVPFWRRRRQAEAERDTFATQLGQLRADNQALREQLTRLHGLEAAQLAGELDRQRDELARARRQLAEERDVFTRVAAEEEARHNGRVAEADRRLRELRERLVATEDAALLQEAGIYAYRHVLEDAVAYKSQLAGLTDQVKAMARAGDAVTGATNWTVDGSLAKGRRMVRDFSKLMLRAYNAEADYAVRSMRPHRLHSLIGRLDKSRETIARLGATMHIGVSDRYHRLRIRELELTADYLAKQEEEKERRRELREQQREEEKLRREIERERARLDKERRHYESALVRLRAAGDVSTPAAIEDLRAKLADVESAMEAVARREANIRAGYVYVISNIGAFGERMVKIGLTRRLEPMDRVNELGDASVPFKFDVHALIFSEDAVGLEKTLHREFDDRRVNRVNARREFFYVRPSEVRTALQRLAGQHLLEFREDAEAPEWRASGAARDA